MRGRFDNRDYILTLDPKKDFEEIVRLVHTEEYPWLLTKSLEFALFRTYAVPQISGILAESGQFQRHGQKRYDDTTLMLAAIVENGIESDYGRRAIRRMNQLHGRWNIQNEDYLYVLSAFVFEPIRWHEKYGWRQPTEPERLANFYFWREVGIRMGIQDIPETFDEFERFNIDYEQRNFRFSESNRIIGDATVKVFTEWYAAPLRPAVRRGLFCFMDDTLLQAFAFPKQHIILRATVKSALWLMGKTLRYMPPRRRPYILTEQPNRTYTDGKIDPDRLGPGNVPPPQAETSDTV